MSCCARPTTLSLPMMMTDVDRLLRDYIERFEAGGSEDPTDLMEGLEAKDRQKLSVLIEGYLEHAARPQEWNPEAFEGSAADRAVQRVADQWSAAGELPGELVRLRNEGEITREDLVTKLADSLGVSAAREKVASYYHRLERGLLPAEGVSAKVWNALASLLGTTGDSLREAASRGAAEEAGPAFARTARPAPPAYAPGAGEEIADTASEESRTEPDEPDEVDRLFTGG